MHKHKADVYEVECGLRQWIDSDVVPPDIEIGFAILYGVEFAKLDVVPKPVRTPVPAGSPEVAQQRALLNQLPRE
jgi:hypothetical protein